MELHTATVKTAFEHAELICKIWDWQQRLVSAKESRGRRSKWCCCTAKGTVGVAVKMARNLSSGLRSATTTITVLTAALCEVIANNMFLTAAVPLGRL